MNLGPTITIVLLALGLAVQPWAILAAVVLASAHRGTAKALAFLIGWSLTLAAIGYVGVLMHPHLSGRGSSSAALYVVDVCIGVVLAAWLTWQWRRAPSPARTAEPKWMAHVDTTGPIVALGLGVFLPNYLFVLAAVNQMLETSLDTTWLVVAVTGFVVVASIGVAVPLILMIVTPRRAADLNQGARVWLVEHTRVVTFSLGALIAAVLIVKGLLGLAG